MSDRCESNIGLLAATIAAWLLLNAWAPCAWAVDVPGAQAASPAVAAAEAASADAPPQTPGLDKGDNAWLLTSSALVLMMTGPGLALFYGGLVRKKNVLSVMMQCTFLMAMMSVLWALYGYTLSFGGDGAPTPPKWIGNLDHLFLRGVQAELRDGHSHLPPHPVFTTLPRMTHMLFQAMFFVITPALICGAFAERMKFSAMVLFMILWGTVVYIPLCHWVWGGGILAYGSPNAVVGHGALDFAGGTVVHIASGVSALVCALMLGKRLGYGSEPMPPHNLTYTTMGAALLWIGWFGFNAGSALQADGIAASAFAATHFAAAAGGLAWATMEWITRGKPSVLGTASGVVAGLVCITPAAGYTLPMHAILMGLAAGVACFLACTKLKSMLRYDDALDAFGVHGIGGTLGAILTGVFATRAVNDVGKGKPLGLVDGGDLIFAQIGATVITWALALVASFVILKIVDALVGLRVSAPEEIEGLDLSQHGEEGYIFI